MAVNLPCPYCGAPGKNLLYVELSDGESVLIDITGNLLRAYAGCPPFIETVPINYCPICGAKLPRAFP